MQRVLLFGFGDAPVRDFYLASVVAARQLPSTLERRNRHDDEAALHLYAKLGQREDVIHFDIEPSNGAG